MAALTLMVLLYVLLVASQLSQLFNDPTMEPLSEALDRGTWGALSLLAAALITAFLNWLVRGLTEAYYFRVGTLVLSALLITYTIIRGWPVLVYRVITSDSTPLAVLMILTSGLGIYLMFWRLPKALLGGDKDKLELKDYLTLENSIRTTLLQITGGVVVIAGLYFTAQSISLSQENVKLALRKAEEDRLSQAVLRLNDDKWETRLAAIVDLGRISSGDRMSRRLITELLASYVRNHAKWVEGESGEAMARRKPPMDIVEAVSTLSLNTLRSYHDMSTPYLGGGEPDEQILAHYVLRADLSETDLRGMRVTLVHMMMWVVERAHLGGSSFINGDFSRGSFVGSKFTESELRGATFRNADLTGADLSGASLIGADFTKAKLDGAILSGSDIKRAKLKEAYGLTAEQVKSARNYDSAELPDDIRRQVTGN